MSIEGDPRATLLNFQGLLNRLGVRGVTTLDFLPHILPVAIVDGQVSAVATSSPPLDTPFTAGELTSPVANTRLADTGALVAGQYNITLALMSGDINNIRLRRRNAADNADIWSQRLAVAQTPGAFLTLQLRLILAAGERVVVEIVSPAVLNSVYQASIWVQGPF